MKQPVIVGAAAVVLIVAVVLAALFWPKGDQESQGSGLTYKTAKSLVSEIPGTDQCADPGQAPGPVPDGATIVQADLEEFIEQFKAYDKAVVDYQECLRQAALEVAVDLTQDHKQSIFVVGNHYADQAIATGDALNEQIRAFKAAHPSD